MVLTVLSSSLETWKVGKNMTNKRGDFAIGYLGNQVVAAGGLGEYMVLE